MKRFLIPLVALLTLAGCSSEFITDWYEDAVIVPLQEEGSTDSLFVSIFLEYAKDGMPGQAMEAMNQCIFSQAFDLEQMTQSLEETAVTYRENLIDEYLTENEGKEGMCTWEDDIDGSFLPDWDGKKNYILQYFSFRGGAHGIMTVSYLCFDAKTGQHLTEADLFKEGYEEPLTELLQAAAVGSLAYEEELADLLDTSLVTPNGNFVMDEDGIVWAYQPYEVGPYALGIVTSTLYWDQLKPLLK